jgi:hypothetical protein
MSRDGVPLQEKDWPPVSLSALHLLLRAHLWRHYKGLYAMQNKKEIIFTKSFF